MSSVANNHSSFGQPQPLKASPTSNAPIPFYSKRDPNGTLIPDNYSLDVGSGMRSRQSDYSNWSSPPPPPQMNAQSWNELNCDPNPPAQVGSLPAAQSLLSHSASKNPIPATSTTATVITNQNGKNFTAPTTTTFHGYDDHQQQYLPPTTYPHKRNATYSGPRPPYLNNPTPSSIPQLDYADSHSDVYQAKSTSAFHHIPQDAVYPGYRFARESKMHAPINSGLHSHGGTNTLSSRPQSAHSSDAETTASSTRGASSLPSTGALSMTTSGGIGATSQCSQNKRQRKPAPTLATGRRNLKNEEVDQEEAERRKKRRERNRKSAQKCRERKMHRTNELQTQVTNLNSERDKLLALIESLKSCCRQYVEIIETHCPNYNYPRPSCLNFTPESYLTSATSMPMDVDSMQFSGMLEQTDSNCYTRPPEGNGYGTLPTGDNSTTAPGAPVVNLDTWNGNRYSQPVNQLPPVSQFVPHSDHISTNLPPLVKSEPTSAPTFWNGDEGHPDVEWKADNDTDSPPSRLNTPTTNDVDKASTLSSSL